MAAYPHGEVMRTAPEYSSGLNPTGRDITLTGPARDGDFILGEITYVLTAADEVRLSPADLLVVLSPVLEPSVRTRLQEALGSDRIGLPELEAAGLRVSYNPRTFGLDFIIPVEFRPRAVLSLGGLPVTGAARYERPATRSAYLTAVAAADYVHKGGETGFATPFVLVEGAARIGSLVAEMEGTAGDTWRREGTRLVFDDLSRTARWTLGDLEPVSRGFSGATPMAGVSVVRSYSELEPQRNVQPRGERTFTVARPSTVETFINGRIVQQVRLNPGTYDLRDFPFAQGSNDIRLVIRDETGVEQVLNFSIFFDRNLLAAGLTEFGAFVGTEAVFGENGREYDSRFTSSGYIRRGVSDELTLGANYQVGERGAVVGSEWVWAGGLGTLGGDVAVSSVDGIGSGYALNFGFEREFGRASGLGGGVTATLQVISEDFATPQTVTPRNPYAYELGVSYSQALSSRRFFAADAFYSAGRGAEPDRMSGRATYGWRVSDRLAVSTELSYEDRNGRDDYGARIGLTYRFSSQTSASGEYDSRRERARLGLQTSSGRGVGSWSAGGALDYTASASALNASLTTVRNRAELGLTHMTSFGAETSQITDQRTSVRAGGSLAYAGGQFALGRPIYDSFALVTPHKSLKARPVYIDPRDADYSARSDRFGPAVITDLGAYSARAIVYDVPDAPPGYDLGDGVVRVLPPYRAGYRLEVGSDYAYTVTGTMVSEDGEPIALLAGEAREETMDGRGPLQFFTNRTGRFALSSLRPGRWILTVGAGVPRRFIIDIPHDAAGVVQLGTLRPEAF